MRCMECDRPSLNLLEFLGENFLPLVQLEASAAPRPLIE